MSNASSRRQFLSHVGKGAGALALTPSLSLFSGSSCASPQKEKLGIALVGLGRYSTGQLGPALRETQHCYLSGIVTGTPEKADRWADEYNIKAKNIYNYEEYDDIADNSDIDIIYVVLPNSMHAEFTIRALEAGKHVICEKPMAMNAEEGKAMIAAAEKAGKKLGVGYRLYYDPYHVEMMRLGQEKVYGDVMYLECALGYHYEPDLDDWHAKKAMGGGALYNLGVYPIQGARYTKGMEPIAVQAQSYIVRKELFPEVNEIWTWQMEFPDHTVANCHTSAAADIDRLFASAEEGVFELEPSYKYSGQGGYSPAGKFDYPQVNQQALQMDDFALCIKENRESIVAADKHIMDLHIIDGIHKSLELGGERVELPRPEKGFGLG